MGVFDVIASLTDVKNFLGLSAVTSTDTPLQLCLTAADAVMKTYCNRTFESARFNRYLDPTNTSTIIVPDIPLISVHGMTAFQYVNDVTGQACILDYVKWYRSGNIFSSEGLFDASFPNSVQVDYTSGYTDSDPEWETLKWIQLEISSELFRGRGLLHLQSYQAGGAQFQRIVQVAPDFIAMLSPEVLIMLGMFATRGPRIDY